MRCLMVFCLCSDFWRVCIIICLGVGVVVVFFTFLFVLCCVVLCCVVFCRVVFCCVVFCCVLLCWVVSCLVALWCAVMSFVVFVLCCGALR